MWQAASHAGPGCRPRSCKPTGSNRSLATTGLLHADRTRETCGTPFHAKISLTGMSVVERLPACPTVGARSLQEGGRHCATDMLETLLSLYAIKCSCSSPENAWLERSRSVRPLHCHDRSDAWMSTCMRRCERVSGLPQWQLTFCPILGRVRLAQLPCRQCRLQGRCTPSPCKEVREPGRHVTTAGSILDGGARLPSPLFQISQPSHSQSES